MCRLESDGLVHMSVQAVIAPRGRLYMASVVPGALAPPHGGHLWIWGWIAITCHLITFNLVPIIWFNFWVCVQNARKRLIIPASIQVSICFTMVKMTVDSFNQSTPKLYSFWLPLPISQTHVVTTILLSFHTYKLHRLCVSQRKVPLVLLIKRCAGGSRMSRMKGRYLLSLACSQDDLWPDCKTKEKTSYPSISFTYYGQACARLKLFFFE